MNENKVEVGESSLPESWQMVRIDEIGEVVTGTTPKTSKDEYYGGEIPFVRPAELGSGRRPDRTEKTLTSEGLNVARPLPPGSVLVSCIGLLGKVAQANKISATNQQINAVIPGYKVDQGFAYWVLHLARVKMKRLAGLQVVPIVNKTQFSGIELPVPPIAEQRRIADVLDTVDAAIRETDAVIAKQEQVKSGLLQDLLTRGLDANGRLRDPEANPGAFRETELARVPEDWSIRPLREVADIGSGLTINRSRTKENPVKIPYLRVANVQDGYLDLEKVKTVEVSASKVSRYLLQEGDVLMTEGGDFDKLGRGTVWEGQVKPCAHQNHIFRVRTDRSALLPHFLSALSGSSYGKRYFIRNSKQTTNLATINQTQLKRFPVLCPPIEEQRQIVGRLSAFEKLLTDERAYQVKLQRLKTGLMQDLLTGRVRVPEAEAHINKVIT